VGDPIPGVSLGDVVSEDAVATTIAATDLATGEAVTVRRLHRPLAAEEGARLVFAEEVRRVGTLRHPHLLAVRRADPAAPVPYYVADPVTGGTLATAREAGPLGDERFVRATVRGLLDALRHLESRGQFHAAPLPSRIVRVADAWKLVTFRDVRADDEALRTKGKPPPDPDWAPPEVAADHPAPVRARTLLPWNVGALWLWLRTGHPPAAARAALAERVLERPPPPPSHDEHVIASFLEREPLRRPSGAEACLRALDALDGRASARPAPPPRPLRRRPPS
jgi:hypothetical protein